MITGEAKLKTALAEREAAGLYRRRRILEGMCGPHVRIDGREFIAFCSNDYLGLAAHPRVIGAFRNAADEAGVGSGAAHLVCGHHRHHHELEEKLAAFTGRERALLFSTGYMANLGIATALASRGDLVLEDRLNHASLLDAGLLSGARFARYRHADVDDAERRLAASDARVNLLLTDGVFSMDGDIAPLPDLADACARHDAWLVVDDAHGLGVLGANGAGTLEHFGLDPARAPVLMGTLGKAFGGFGAFVAGSEALIETLVQHARTYIYTTALPPALAAAVSAALDVAAEEPWRREKLQTLIQRFRRGVETIAQPGPSATRSVAPTPIVPIVVGDAKDALALAERLETRGILVTPIRPPTVPEGTARLRITLSASHDEADVDMLLDALCT